MSLSLSVLVALGGVGLSPVMLRRLRVAEHRPFAVQKHECIQNFTLFLVNTTLLTVVHTPLDVCN